MYVSLSSILQIHQCCVCHQTSHEKYLMCSRGKRFQGCVKIFYFWVLQWFFKKQRCHTYLVRSKDVRNSLYCCDLKTRENWGCLWIWKHKFSIIIIINFEGNFFQNRKYPNISIIVRKKNEKKKKYFITNSIKIVIILILKWFFFEK